MSGFMFGSLYVWPWKQFINNENRDIIAVLPDFERKFRTLDWPLVYTYWEFRNLRISQNESIPKAMNQRGFYDYILLVIKGLAMGIANKVPGVSGGIVAIVTGFYPEFLYSLCLEFESILYAVYRSI